MIRRYAARQGSVSLCRRKRRRSHRVSVSFKSCQHWPSRLHCQTYRRGAPDRMLGRSPLICRMAATLRGSGKWICHHHVLLLGNPFHEQRGSIEKRLPSIAPLGDDPAAVLDADASPGTDAGAASNLSGSRRRRPFSRTTPSRASMAAPTGSGPVWPRRRRTSLRSHQ